MINVFLISLFVIYSCSGRENRSQLRTTQSIDTLESEVADRPMPVHRFRTDNRSKAARSKIDALQFDSSEVYDRVFPFRTKFFYDPKSQLILSVYIEYPYIDFIKTNLSDQIDFGTDHLGLIDRPLPGYLQDGMVKVLVVGPAQLDFTIAPYHIEYKEGHIFEYVQNNTYVYKNISQYYRDSLMKESEYDRIHIQGSDSFIRAELAYPEKELLSQHIQELYHKLQSTAIKDDINLDDVTVQLSMVVDKDGVVKSDVGFKYKAMKDYVDFSHGIKDEFEDDLTQIVKTMKFSTALNEENKPIKSLYQLAIPFYQVEVPKIN